LSKVKNRNLAEKLDPEDQLNRIFHALSDPTRRALLNRISQAPEKVTSLAEPFNMSLNAISKHLKTLEKAELVDRDNAGRTSICSLRAEPLHNAQLWLEQYTRFWGDTLDALSQHMDRQIGAESEEPKGST
jgi:DNA-binding transcriptional ArsR family regulator